MKVSFLHTKLESWINELEPAAHAKVVRMIELLKEKGHEIGLPYSKSLRRGLFELRIHGDQPIRIFYTFHRNQAVLLHGCIKKSHRLEKHELERAWQLMRQLD
ncbi:MAG: type II toxin-antitoxin system RelE/ParE family toxin [Candidatus Uhrbacteria bacterium]